MNIGLLNFEVPGRAQYKEREKWQPSPIIQMEEPKILKPPAEKPHEDIAYITIDTKLGTAMKISNIGRSDINKGEPYVLTRKVIKSPNGDLYNIAKHLNLKDGPIYLVRDNNALTEKEFDELNLKQKGPK